MRCVRGGHTRFKIRFSTSSGQGFTVPVWASTAPVWAFTAPPWFSIAQGWLFMTMRVNEQHWFRMRFNASRMRLHCSGASFHDSRVSIHGSRLRLHSSKVSLHCSIVSFHFSRVTIHTSRVTLHCCHALTKYGTRISHNDSGWDPNGYKMSLIHSSKLSFLCFRVSLHSSKKKLLGVPPYLQVDPPHLQDEPQMIQAVFQQF